MGIEGEVSDVAKVTSLLIINSQADDIACTVLLACVLHPGLHAWLLHTWPLHTWLRDAWLRGAGLTRLGRSRLVLSLGVRACRACSRSTWLSGLPEQRGRKNQAEADCSS